MGVNKLAYQILSNYLFLEQWRHKITLLDKGVSHHDPYLPPGIRTSQNSTKVTFKPTNNLFYPKLWFSGKREHFVSQIFRDWSLLIPRRRWKELQFCLPKTHKPSKFPFKFSYPIRKSSKNFITQHVQAFYVLIRFLQYLRTQLKTGLKINI